MTSVRAQVITRRTYNRPLEDGSFESWGDTVSRACGHQKRLWEDARGRKLGSREKEELHRLELYMLDRKVMPSGRTLWLGGTDIAYRRASSQFNCSTLEIKTVHDVVDALWLLLQGCGVGFTPVPGTLNGFTKPIPNIELIPSTRTSPGGQERNLETWDHDTKTWTIRIGDSAEAWAKSIGKLLAGKFPAEKLILDFSEIRPAGHRLKGYGWISSGDNAIRRAYKAIIEIMNRRASQLLTKIDLLDIVNWLGTILSSRRSAQIALVEYGSTDWKEFASAKHDHYKHNRHRSQSNNSLVFYDRPSHPEIESLLNSMLEYGGSEPGLINGEAALKRAPWFSGVNPCAEVLLGDKGFCNLVEINLPAFRNSFNDLLDATKLIARANYRQTCVNLDDGILQRAWHQNNEFLRLCGVGITGIVQSDLSSYDFKRIRAVATCAAYSMADELALPHPKNVTTIKPSGSLSKCMDCTEGAHRPPGRFIYNHVGFSAYDPLVPILQAANYHTFPNPADHESILVRLPVEFSDVRFDSYGGRWVNQESAIDQLERYKTLMQFYVDQNCSLTVSYDPGELPGIGKWLHENWDSYVGVSFLLRADPTKTAQDLGYEYLPQEVVTEDEFRKYQAKLKPVNLDEAKTAELYELQTQTCSTGACPAR